MTLRLLSIEGSGDIERERVVLRATAEVDIGRYAIFNANKSERGEPYSGNIPYTYWFPFKHIKDGDLVVLYTKEGTKSEKTLELWKHIIFLLLGTCQAKVGGG